MKTVAVLIIGVFINITFAFADVDTTKVVIHHTATAKTTTVECIRRYHVENKGWRDIGYHFLIRYDGKVFTGRPIEMKGAHARGRNHYIGIALIGYDSFTVEQIHSLITLLKQLKTTHIERHHEECPGSGLDIKYIRRSL